MVGFSNDDPVSTWEDLIGADDATGSLTTRPLYKTNAGDPYVHWDGIDDKLSLSNMPTGDFSITVVWQYHAKKAYGILFGNASDSLQLGYESTNDNLLFQTVGGGGTLLRPIPATPTGFMVGYAERVSTSGKLRVDGSETTGSVSGSAISGSWLLGEFGSSPTTYQGDIDVKEIIICDAAVTGSDFTSLATYINNEYGLTL
jgi:hypothetical protein